MCSRFLSRGRNPGHYSFSLRRRRPLKIVVIGDSGSGKTKLMKRFEHKTFTDQAEEDMVDLIHTDVELQGKNVSIVIYDIPAGKNKIMFDKTDVFVLCFDTCNKESLTSIKQKWVPMIESAKLPRNFQLMLVGTKKDERDRNKHRNSRINYVPYDLGRTTHKEIKANLYLECSAKTGDGVSKVFEVACFLANSRRKYQKAWFEKFDDWRNSSTHSTML